MIVLFDLSGVFFKRDLKEVVKRISKKYFLDPQKLEFVLIGPFSFEYRKGLVYPEDFWKRVKEYLNIEDVEKIKHAFFNAYYPYNKTIKFIKKLKQRKIQVAFISNSPKDRVKYLNRKYNFISLFDFGLFSFEVNVCKPDKGIYEKFLEKFNLKASEVIYIDDKEKNLEPAKELGIKTILFKNIEQLECGIRELL